MHQLPTNMLHTKQMKSVCGARLEPYIQIGNYLHFYKWQKILLSTYLDLIMIQSLVGHVAKL